MVIIIAEAEVKQGCEEAYIALAEKLIEASRAEAGCEEYLLTRDAFAPECFYCIERWKDEQSLEQHFASEHFRTIVPRLNTMRLKSEVHKYLL